MASQPKALILGAGPAGLTAAYKLLKETNIKPVIFETGTQVGGISRTVNFKGNRIDIGGHRFFSKNNEAQELWFSLMSKQSAPALDDLLLKREKKFEGKNADPEREDRVMLLRSRVSRIFYLRKFFDYPISLKLETFTHMGLVRTLCAGLGYLVVLFHKRKEKSLEDFYINRFGKPLYKMFFEDYTEKVWGIHPSKISPEWGAQRVKGISVLTLLLGKARKQETSLIEEFYYPKLGPGQYWETMANEIIKLGGEIHLNSSVVGVESSGRKIVSCEVQTAQGVESYSGDYFFNSLAMKDFIACMKGEVPSELRSIAQKLPYRDFITVGLLLNQLSIKNTTSIKTLRELVPDNWIYIQEPDVKIGRLQIFNNWSPYMVKDLQNTVWIGLEYFCQEGDELWKKTEKDFLDFAIEELVKIDVIKKEDVLDAVQIKVKKAYPAYFGTYNQFSKIKDFLCSFENLFCIGRNGQHRYNNMDHSMVTAIEAVQIINGKSDQNTLWNVNTEEDYHETKKSS